MSFGENVRKDSVVRLLTSAIFTGLVRDGAVAGCIKIKVLFWAEYDTILKESIIFRAVKKRTAYTKDKLL